MSTVESILNSIPVPVGYNRPVLHIRQNPAAGTERVTLSISNRAGERFNIEADIPRHFAIEARSERDLHARIGAFLADFLTVLPREDRQALPDNALAPNRQVIKVKGISFVDL